MWGSQFQGLFVFVTRVRSRVLDYEQQKQEETVANLLTEGEELLAANRPVEALQRFEQALTIIPDHLEAQELLDQTNDLLEAKKQEHQTITAVALRQERETTLRKILKKYERIAVEELAQLLQFRDGLEVKRWILELPKRSSFKSR